MDEDDKYGNRIVGRDDPDGREMSALMGAIQNLIAAVSEHWSAAGATNESINGWIGNALANSLALQIVRTMDDPADGLKMADAIKDAVMFYMSEGKTTQ